MLPRDRVLLGEQCLGLASSGLSFDKKSLSQYYEEGAGIAWIQVVGQFRQD